MGREIRMVPPNWQHPKKAFPSGVVDYKPLYDQDFASAAAEWKSELAKWEDGTHEDLKYRDAGSATEWWEYSGNPPERECYRPAWTEAEATHFQIYETVSEGTPVSPVFATRDELAAWLIQQGTSEAAAKKFAQEGFCFSLSFGPNGIKQDYETTLNHGA